MYLDVVLFTIDQTDYSLVATGYDAFIGEFISVKCFTFYLFTECNTRGSVTVISGPEQKNHVGKTFRRKEATRTFSNSVEMELASLLLYLVRIDETVYLHHLVQISYKEAAVLLVSARRIRQVCLHASLDFQLPYWVYGATPPTL